MNVTINGSNNTVNVTVNVSKAKGKRMLKRDIPRGVILYRGPSAIDGRPIVVVATGLKEASENEKTGAFIQTYILADNGQSPLQSAYSGADESVCGDCPHRPQEQADGSRKLGSCYVNLNQGPRSVADGVVRGIYPRFNKRKHLRLFKGKLLRLGAYGDPAAVPLRIWDTVASVASNRTGYTHQWRVCDPAYAKYVMASCETVEDRQAAMGRGYRTFRVRLADQPLDQGEIVCPASAEAGKRRKCETCKACSGAGGGHSPVIIVHGLSWKADKFRRTLDNLPSDRNRIALPTLN